MDKFPWWTELLHGGIIISNPVLAEVFTERTVDSGDYRYRRLRDRYNTFLAKESQHTNGTHPVHEWITHIFEDFLQHTPDQWLKGNDIPHQFKIISRTGIQLKPRRVLMDGDQHPLLLLQTDNSQRLGVYRGRRSYAQFVELLRRTEVPLGILTNGHQLRLVYAGLDHDAWVQWQVDAWFDEGEIRHQLDGLVTLLGPEALDVKDGSFQLLDAVTLSRIRQADLADVLGDQIRQAVEILTSAVGRVQQTNAEFFDLVQSIPGTDSNLTKQEMLSALYQAATRLVMRMVILFYADAKGLLPKDYPFYLDNYSLEGLYRQLLDASQHEGFTDLETRYSAWPRFLALSQLVHQGSDHEILPLKAYGGTLFRQGNARHTDPVFRALSLFEDPVVRISDADMLSILRLIKLGKTKVRQGRSFTWVSGPVDFTDLRTEYIGIMYEGLLDYELRIVEKDSPKVILKIGNQPILPLSLLEPMDERAIKNLFEKMKVESEAAKETAETDMGTLFEEQTPEEAPEAVDDTTPAGRAFRWAVRAVEAGRLVRRPRGSGVDQQLYQERARTKARSLIVKVLEPGEMYLARWGGTRKGSGTFYTKPALAVPTTQRTLEPLVYDTTEDGSRKVKTPAEILNLKICDPAVGSGTFLVAAARYLTEALYESVLTHILVDRDEEGNVAHVPAEIPLTADLSLEPPPLKPTDDGWEEQMKARLKRYVVENCLYGVDINAMAVELARLSLWIETMSRDLPFEFLDHRLRQGNSLIGCWYAYHDDYPVKAWDREGGDGPRGDVTRQIKTIRNQVIKPEIIRWLERYSAQYDITEERQTEEEVIHTHLKAWSLLKQTALTDTEKREEIYYKKIGEDREYNRIKNKFDRWAATWFWPVMKDGESVFITPLNFDEDNERLDDIVRDLKARYHFFHWELEFPDVFVEKGGFDAILGNPPWNTLQPESLEFFSNYDPIYRTYGKQEALRRQRELFEEDPSIENEWIRYSAYFKAISNYVKSSLDPFAISLGRGSAYEQLRQRWESIRQAKKGYIVGELPYRHQGTGKIDLYQLFLELGYQLLRPDGRLGILSPSGIYTDMGNTELRRLFLSQTDWDWLFSFENRKKIFNIHRSYKFGPLILTKGGTTSEVKAAFMRHDPADWEARKPPHILIPVTRIRRFSPNTLSFMEFKSEKDLEICEKIYGDRPLLGDQVEGGWSVRFSQEFNMTSDSKLFPPIKRWEDEAYRPDKLGRWVNPDGDIALPLYEGRMIDQFDFSSKGWVSGKGRSAVWRAIPCDNKVIEPQFLMGKSVFQEHADSILGHKVPIMNITSATNTRTVIAGFLRGVPCSHSLNPVTLKEGYLSDYLSFCAALNSFAYDYQVRQKLGGLNLSFFVLEETVLPILEKQVKECISLHAARLTLLHPLFIPEWERMIGDLELDEIILATNRPERVRTRCIIDAIIFEAYDLDIEDVEYILDPDPSNTTGFFRVDEELPLEQRQTTLTLEAFKHLKEVGLERFLDEGWELPEYVTEFDRPGIKVWEPEGGWQRAWAEAGDMLSEEEWNEFAGDGKQATTPSPEKQGKLGLDVKSKGQQGVFD